MLSVALAPCALRAAAPSPPLDPSYYAYDSQAPFTATETPYGEKSGVHITRVTYPSPVKTPFTVNNTVTAYLFLPSGPGPHPAMVVLHEWLPPKGMKDEFRLCQGIAHAQVAALLIVEPYSLERRPKPTRPDAELLSGNVPQMVAGLRQCVLDTRRGLDWLSRRPDIDPQRMGAAGISLGGILAPLVAGVDRRARVLLTLVGGGDVADIVWNSYFTKGLKPEMRKRGYTEDSLREAMRPVEPTEWLQGFDPKNALLINGRYDIFVTPHDSQTLARALGGAKIVWANTGHYGIALSEAQAEAVGVQFLRSRFFGDPPTFAPPTTLRSHTIKLGFLIGGREKLLVSPALAYQIINFDSQGRYSLDGQLTFHGLSGGLSARLTRTSAIGLDLPLRRGPIKTRPYLLMHFVL